MISESEQGGDPACWAHLFADRDLETRADIEDLVRAFYRQVAMDDLLGPIFAVAGVDWSTHIPKLVDFWAGQLLGERSYEGNLMPAHRPVNARTPFTAAHYQRWLDLFEAEVDRGFRGPLADQAKHRAGRFASALPRLLAGAPSPAGGPMEVKLGRRPAT